MFIHIVPKIRPQIDSVGEHAYLLAESIKREYQIDSVFITADTSAKYDYAQNEFKIVQLKDRLVSESINTLSELIKPDSVIILHYVGYGYARKGTPFWLEKAIRGIKVKFPGTKLLINFHEVAASSSPWKSAFWLRPFQEYIATQLAINSDACITSNPVNADILRKLAPESKDKITIMPVFSNMGEVSDCPPFQERKNRLVIFGTAGRRTEVYKRSKILENLVEKLQISEIIDIGAGNEQIPGSILNRPVNIKGVLSAEDIRNILSTSKYGIIDCPVTLLGRSTIFASYCSLGLLPIVVGSSISKVQLNGLEGNKNYILLDGENDLPQMEQLSEIAAQAFNWYDNHCLKKHSSYYVSLTHENYCRNQTSQI